MVNQEKFISQIAPYVVAWKTKFGFGVPSAIIAQACLESAYGTSAKAKHNNFFGLKFRLNRVTCNSGVFTDTSYEQKPDGTYVPIVTQWYEFADMNTGVEGYYQFIDTGHYSSAKLQTTPEGYLQALKDCGYATSKNYVSNVMSVVNKYNLTKYDGGEIMKPDSPLARLIINSPTTYGKRPKPADRLTIHHMGCFPSPSAEVQCRRFAVKSRRASANYCIGLDGDIVQGLLEDYAPCTSSNKANDMRAITFEVANSSGAPDWKISTASMTSLINLCVDICRRHNIKQLVWSNNRNDRVNGKNGCNMTIHKDFAATACPGPYLQRMMPSIAFEVNDQLEKSGYILNGYDYSPVFDPEYYANKYPDLMSAFGLNKEALWLHFQMFGMNEFRQASAEFNPQIYKDNNPDLVEAFGDDNPSYYWHYVVFGINENRVHN